MLKIFAQKAVIRAMQIAFEAHQTQVDKEGTPYIFHPAMVAYTSVLQSNMVQDNPQINVESLACVALLHDVVEDSDYTLADLANEFSAEVIDAIRLLTKQKGEDYDAYLLRIKANPLALAVKLADVRHNLSKGIGKPKFAHLQEKYRRALAILEAK